MSIPHLGWCLNSRTELEKVSEKLHQLLLAVELPLEPVLAKMEYDGIRIDQPYLKGLSKQLEQYLGRLSSKLTQKLGRNSI